MSDKNGFSERLAGAFHGVAIGDGMGAPVEGWAPEKIAERMGSHDFQSFLPPTHARDPQSGKGSGRITDDTLMTEALARAYIRSEGHLDAYGFQRWFLPEFSERMVWVPEWRREMVLLDRLNPVERYTHSRLFHFAADPRSAGIGNHINCAVAMYIMPTGAVNAGDPRGAYEEAVALASAESSSYGIEGAAVLAAAYASAFAAPASLESVLEDSVGLAQDGTRDALVRVLEMTDPEDPLEIWISKARQSIEVYDHASYKTAMVVQGIEGGEKTYWREPSIPGSRMSIEETPIALAALKWGNGDFVRTLRAGVRYGRDCDSIAGMACGLFGAWKGLPELPIGLCEEVNKANRRDYSKLAEDLEAAIRRIHEKDALRWKGRIDALRLPDESGKPQGC